MVNRITNFFKPFILPKSRVPDNDEEEDEIVVGQGASSIRVPAFPAMQLKSTNGAEPSRGSSASSTPPERTTRGTPQKRSRPSSQEGTTDNDDLYHSTPTPSKQRMMTAVSIPSPKRQMSPPVKVERAAVPSPRGTTSFNSTSTLSSVPMSSQSSSKRIVRNGLQAVTNSDSASADDSDDDLADIETFIPRKKLKITPSPPEHHTRKVPLQDTVKSTRQSSRLSDHSSRSRSHTPYLPPSPPRTEYKHSLLKMAKANQKQEKQKRRVAEIEAQVADAERSRKEREVLEEAELDPQAMAAEIAENSEDEERLGTAIERTEALQEEVTYNFFLEKPARATKQSFPVEGFGQEPFAAIMKDDQAREQACLTGFMADIAAEGLLPHAAIVWFVRQMVYEPREVLCEAYVEIVRLATTDQDALRDAYLALDAGFSDFCFLTPTTTPPILPSVTEPHRRSHPLFAFYNTSAASTKLPEEERAFNSHVDALVAQLKFMASRVRNSGAAHMTRMEAKEALERLFVRAEWGVRTRGRGRREVFGGGGGEGEEVGRGQGVRFLEGLGEKIPDEGVREAEAVGVGIEAKGGEEGDGNAEQPGLESLAGGVTDANVVSRVERTVCAEVAGTSLRLEVSLVATQNTHSTPNLPPAPVVERKDTASSSPPHALDGLEVPAGDVAVVDEAGTVVEADAESGGEQSSDGTADAVAEAEVGDMDVTGAEPDQRVNNAMSDILSAAGGVSTQAGELDVWEGGLAAGAALEGPVALTEKCTFV
ncbi:hypothetical protein LTR48_006447 [Friedmanniomyces endolithicus]|uniref:Rab-GAP TBC domain-containing protein n=1 Tax=Rachicladosporium monterosium TaxID=1507873 RepID=A0ABR0KYW1_9PEZI|nr:hypothetical protein LTR48_006447 [Friedmanniomyces endolithicus]KAK5140870.1 hypothetical protein LTR32_006439 [Rachicladosporium monterosium]